MGNESAPVARPPGCGVMRNELVLRGYLHVVARLGLPVVHRVFLHAHERGIVVGLAVAVPLPEDLQLVLVLLHLRHGLLLHGLDGLAERLVADSRLVHLLQDPLGALSHLR